MTLAYEVPALEYTNEDIKIEVDLTLKHGELPNMAAAFCDKYSVQECRNEATLEKS